MSKQAVVNVMIQRDGETEAHHLSLHSLSPFRVVRRGRVSKVWVHGRADRSPYVKINGRLSFLGDVLEAGDMLSVVIDPPELEVLAAGIRIDVERTPG
jgi:hypothetical protein